MRLLVSGLSALLLVLTVACAKRGSALCLVLVGFLAISACTTSTESLPKTAEFTAVRLSPDFETDGVVFLGTKQHGVFRSDDRGRHWKETSTGIKKWTESQEETQEPGLAGVFSIAISPSFTEDGEVYLASDILYHSTDRGQTWDALENKLFADVRNIAMSPKYEEDRTLFVTARMRRSFPDTYLWRSRDAGDSWERVWDISPKWEGNGQGFSYGDIPREVQFLPDGSIIGGSLLITARSFDYGSRWQPLFASDLNRGGSIACSPNFDEDGICFLGDDRARGNVSRLAVRQGEILDLGFLAAFDDFYPGGGAYGGPGNSIPVAISPTFEADGTAFASAYYESDPRPLLMRSTDKGITWEELALPSDDWVICVDISPNFAFDHTLVVATRHAVFLSTDDGDSWKRVGG